MIFIITLYDSLETDFKHNGIVILSDPISCVVSEELNGAYELTMEYPLLDKVTRAGVITPIKIIGKNIVGEPGINQMPNKWIYLIEGNIIKSNDGQLFRIYHKQKIGTSITVNARHIFYDLIKNFLEDVKITDLTGIKALKYMLDRTQYPTRFTCDGDVGLISTKEFLRKNASDSIIGTDSLVSIWGGELYRDNFNIGYWTNRGNDNGVLIMGGKNLVSINETLDMDNMTTRMLPTGKDDLMLPEKYIDSPYINNYPDPIVNTIAFGDITDIVALRVAAKAYYTTSKCDLPLVSYSVDFVELSKTEEYKNYKILQSVEDGDIVTIRFDKYNLDLKAKVIKTDKDDITGLFKDVTLGNFKGNIATTLSNMSTTLSNITTSDGQVKGSVVQGIIDATKASFKAMSDAATPQTERAILFEDKDINSATYGAMAIGTMGFEIAGAMTNGDWQWSTFGTGKGFTADMIVAGTIMGNLIKAGIISSVDGKIIINLDDGGMTVSGGAFTLVNNDNVVIIDGAHNMHKILVEGTITFNLAEGQLTGTIDVPHGLGYVPAHSAYLQNSSDDFTSLLPLTSISNGDGGTLTMIGVTRCWANSDVLSFRILRDSRYAPADINIIKYFIYKEVAF